MRKLLLVVIALLVLLAAAAMIAPMFISEDSIKGPLLAKIQAATGRKIDVGGQMHIKFFPIAGAHVENMTVSNPQGFNDSTPFMTLKSMDVDLAVLPLLHGGIEIRKLVLDQPNINLHATKDGVKNWLFTPADKSKAETVPASAPSSGSTPVPTNLLLSNVKVEGGAVSYVDDAAGTRWNLKNLDTTVSLNGYNSPFSIDGDGEWNGKVVKVKGVLTTLSTLSSGGQTKVTADVKSDLFSFDIDGVIVKQVYNGKAAVASSSLRELLAWATPGSKPMAVSSPLALDINGNAECGVRACTLSNATLKLDKLLAKGTVKASFTGQVPQIDADLTTDMLDLTPFMPPQHADARSLIFTDAVAATAAGWSDEPLNLASLHAADATINIKTGGITLNKITIGKTLLRARLLRGSLSADMIDADMYGGKGNVMITIDGSAAPASVETRVGLQNIQAEPLLKDADITDRFTGTANFQLAAKGQGKSEHEIVAALAGNGSLKVTDGTIRGVNLADMVNNIKSAFGTTGGTDKTAFSDLSGTFTIAQGIVNNKDLSMTSPAMHLSGQGDINLPARSVNYRLTPQLVRNQNGTQAKGIGVPILVEGSFDHLNYRPDLNGVLQDAIKNPQQFEDELKNSRKGLKDQIPKGTGKSLKGLLKGLGGN